ncbi:MAG: RNA-guided endonuclease InsQ/TnpB family protein [Methanosarcinales archaeon]
MKVTKTTEFKINDAKIRPIERTMEEWSNTVNFYLETLEAQKDTEITVNVNGQKTTQKLLDWVKDKKRCLSALETITTATKLHPEPIVQLPCNVPTEFRRSCINYAIGTYRSYLYHCEIYELAQKYINYAQYGKKGKINKALKRIIKDHAKRWHVVKRLSKYFKKRVIEPPAFPVIKRNRIDFYGNTYKDIRETKSSWFIKVKLYNGMGWYWYNIPVIVKGYHKNALEGAEKLLSPSIRKRNGKFYIYFPVEKNVVINAEVQEEYVVSIDLGIRSLATITVNEKISRKLKKVYFVSGRMLTAYWRKVDYILSKIRSASNNYNKKLIKKWYDLLSKTNNWIAQYVSKKIVDIAEEFKNSVIVFEDLEFNTKDRLGSKNLNRKIHLWIQGKIRELTEFKANWRGIRVAKPVDPAYTSQYHYLDGTKGGRFSPSPKREGNCLFRCSNGAVINSDFNAAQNIFKRYIGIEPNEPIYKIGLKDEVVRPKEHALLKAETLPKASQVTLDNFV